MPEQSGRSPSPVEVVTDWFAGDLTWHAFQVMSDEEMATAVLAALEAAGYVVTAPASVLSDPPTRLAPHEAEVRVQSPLAREDDNGL